MISKAETVEGAEEPFSATISCEHPSCPISPVGRRSKPNNKDPGIWVSKAGKGPCPVLPVPESSGFLRGELLKVSYQSRAFPASNDNLLQVFQVGWNFHARPRGGGSKAILQCSLGLLYSKAIMPCQVL